MTSLASIFRDEVERKVGVPAENLIPDRSPTLGDVQAAYPTGPSLAEALGYGTYADVKGGPRGAGSPYRRRQTLLDVYSRWRRGGRRPTGGPWQDAQRVTIEKWVEAATPLSAMEVLELVVEHGATVTYFSGVFDYQEEREREVDAPVFVFPSVLSRDEIRFTPLVTSAPPIAWARLGSAFFRAWTLAYGLDVGLREEIDDSGFDVYAMSFTIGRNERVTHEYRE